MIDKIGDHEDWKDGMNAFRSKVWEEINRIKDKLKGIESGNNQENGKKS